MSKLLNKIIRRITSNKGPLRAAVFLLAAIVVFTSTYMLILPAVTIETERAEEEAGIVLGDSETEPVSEENISEEADDGAEPLLEEIISEEADTGAEPVLNRDEFDAETGPEEDNGYDDIISETDLNIEQFYNTQSETYEDIDAVPEGTIESEDRDVMPAEVPMPAVTFTQSTREESTEDIRKITVTVEAGEGTFPEGTTMAVTEIFDNEDVNEAVEKAVHDSPEISGKAGAMQAVDITFFDADGNRIEPANPVKVTLSSDFINESYDPVLVHVPNDVFDPYGNDGAGSIENGVGNNESGNAGETETGSQEDGASAPEIVAQEDRISEPEKGSDEIIFTANEFSIYAIVYTVDFSYSVNGNTYEFSLDGGGYISLKELVKVLGICDTADGQEDSANESDNASAFPADEFMAEVDSVAFSAPDLMAVVKTECDTTVGEIRENLDSGSEYSAELTEEEIERINASEIEAGDWVLVSLKPFDTEETLTVTMKGGEVFTVNVTDAQYDGTKVTNLNGATGALINKTNNNAVLSSAQSNNTLKAVAVTVSGDQITTADGSPELTQWTFNYIGNWNGNDHYTISCDAGYLNLGSGSATISSTAQNLIVVTRQSDGETQIRIANDNHDALNNTADVTANGYSAYNNWNYNTNPGEWFTVYELAYPSDPYDLDGQTRAIINNRDGGSSYQALRDEIDGDKDGRGYYVSGNATTYTNTDGVDYSNANDVRWTFEFVKSDSTGSYYRIYNSSGYLYIDPNVTRKSDMPSNQTHSFERALRFESEPGDGSSGDGTLIRVVSNGDGTYLLQNRNGVCIWNYGNNQFWLSTLDKDNENDTAKLNSRFRLTREQEPPHVTVHYVDRNGNVLTGVEYTGSNTDVVDNHDGTFTIPYNTSGSVDLRSQFDFSSIGGDQSEYTYANTHLAGNSASGGKLTYEGYVIDSLLSASNGDLIIHSDSGETWPKIESPQGNLAYGALTDFSLSGELYRRPANASGSSDLIKYVESGDKDIYVILDPVPTETSAAIEGTDPGDVKAPELEKTMRPNDDGTYTLSLKVDAHARNAAETNKANVLFVVDTSSSMRAYTYSNTRSRITDTHDAVLDLGDRLLAYNASHSGAVEVSMITFDGSVVERLRWTDDANVFEEAVNTYLRYYYLHTGTDWEDGMKSALNKLQNGTDDDPTFVIFFTDGEPSQYTAFSGAGENTNTNAPDPITNNTSHEQVANGYPNFYSYFLSRESSKDEMRAIVNEGAQLYGIYAYNSTNDSYSGYNGSEDGAKMLHNAIKYGYNTNESLEGNLFFEAHETSDLIGAFDKIFNSITEKVGFSNVVVEDGIAAGVTSSTVIDGDVTGFTYTITDNKGQLAYKVTVAPNGASKLPEGETAAEGTPLFWFSESGPPVVGQIKTVSATKIKKDGNGTPILDGNGNYQTEAAEVNVYYYKDADDNEYIMPISTTGEDISWDLSPLGLLKDGYSYEVSFVVWPNQEAYDLVADLNNGKRPDIEATANWENCPIKTDKSGRQYRQGGFPDYPYISRYEDNGVYSAMSNTDQRIDYYKFDTKIVNGEEVEIITHDSKEVPPPDPMPLTASYSHIEKQWNVERDRGIFAQYLYNTDGTSKQFKVDFDIFQGSNLTTPYKTVSLGWDPEANNGQGAYIWAQGDTMTNVTYAGYPHQIGTRWTNNFSIATGLMLTSGRMEELGLNKSLYPSAEYGGETYYILEPGHDYRIKEHQAGLIGYEFDFSAPVYHPMLVDNVLQNVEITYTRDSEGNIVSAEITDLTDSEEGLSSIKVENTLRGYINLNKIVVDEDDQRVESDNTKFDYTIKLESTTEPGPFKGDHIPWYGVGGLFYNDGHENYYQVYETTDGVWKIKNENGEEYTVTSTGFDPDNADEQTVIYKIDETHSKSLVLFGNQMSATADGKTATATLAITQNETLNIANVPVGTEYTITEAEIDEYTLVSILKEVKNGDEVESSKYVEDISGREAIGTIVSNRDNHVTFKNKVITGSLNITKTIEKNGIKDDSATGTFYYAVYDQPYDSDADPAQTPVRTGHIDVTQNGTATVTEPDLKIGQYYVYELTGEGGTPVIGGGLFSEGRYYAVTTTGSPALVEPDETSTAGIVNNYETIPVTATKVWADSNPEHLTVYFKLFYENAAGVDITTGTALKELAYGVTEVTWPEMPKYDENGNEYNYIVREYVIDEEHGEYTEGGHRYTEAAPNGYVNTEEGLTVTNTKLETYEPVTAYSGLKLWVDTINGSKTRPDGLDVTLMIDKEPYGDPAGDVPALNEEGNPYQLGWTTVDEDEWRYTFHNLPIFDEDNNIIRYYAVETPVNGYAGSVTAQTDTQYVYTDHTLDHTDNDAYPVMSSDADLVYTAVRIQFEGHLHHIWTQRVPTAEEKTRLVELVNSDLRTRNLPADATVNNVRWVSGLPINHEFVWKAQPNGYKVSFTRQNTNTIHVKVDNHSAFSNICCGTLQYNYTAGSTDLRNELEPVSYAVEKTWAEGQSAPDGAEVGIRLIGKIPGTATDEIPDPAPVEIDLAAAGVTQKTEVTLNGGGEGGDDTAEAPWKYSWSGLPQYDKGGHPITYSSAEISYNIDGKTVDLTKFAPEESTGPDGQTVFTNQIPKYNFEILKIDSVSATPLPGAEFTIQAVEPESSTENPETIGETAPGDPAATGDDGKTGFNNIPIGYYEIHEAKIPDGYITLDDEEAYFYVKVDAQGIRLLKKVITDGKLSFEEALPNAEGKIIVGNVELSVWGNTITFTVENTSGAELPYTGGRGSRSFAFFGSLLILGAGLLMIVRRRFRGREHC